MDAKDEELAKLLKRCALKDEAALKQLYDQLSPWLTGVAFRILKSAELSNDVLQEAFVQVWNNAASYRPEKAKPLTWICSILRYRALDRLDKEKKHQDKRVDDEDLHALDNYVSADNVERAVQDSEVSAHLNDCLQTISERLRTCIKLAYLYGYSRDEIAEHFASPVNTVKSWLRRGAEKLRECLETKL